MCSSYDLGSTAENGIYDLRAAIYHGIHDIGATKDDGMYDHGALEDSDAHGLGAARNEKYSQTADYGKYNLGKHDIDSEADYDIDI